MVVVVNNGFIHLRHCQKQYYSGNGQRGRRERETSSKRTDVCVREQQQELGRGFALPTQRSIPFHREKRSSSLSLSPRFLLDSLPPLVSTTANQCKSLLLSLNISIFMTFFCFFVYSSLRSPAHLLLLLLRRRRLVSRPNRSRAPIIFYEGLRRSRRS